MKNLLFVLLGAVLFCAIMWFAVTHFPDGLGRWVGLLVAVAVFALCAFGPGRLWGKSNRLNSFALPLVLLMVQEPSAWWLVPLLLVVVLWIIGMQLIIDWVKADRWCFKEVEPATKKQPWYLLRRN